MLRSASLLPLPYFSRHRPKLSLSLSLPFSLSLSTPFLSLPPSPFLSTFLSIFPSLTSPLLFSLPFSLSLPPPSLFLLFFSATLLQTMKLADT